MVRCVDVRKSYHTGGRSVEALRGVDFEITKPGFYGIMGRSGSGKSTLLHLLAGLDHPDGGELYVGDKALHNMAERDFTEFRRRAVGVVFQQFNLIATLTAVENAELPGVLAGEPASKIRKRAMALLDELGLADRADHRPEALSGGEQQRVAIARGLLFQPPVLLADEPTGNLDSANAERLWGVLRRVAKEHDTTVVMVTHEPTAASQCERVVIMQDGRVAGHIDTEGLDAAGVATRYQQLVRAA
ncbi:MAG: ABC transporter ATP-binding protein [Planctomycetota bacterium]